MARLRLVVVMTRPQPVGLSSKPSLEDEVGRGKALPGFGELADDMESAPPAFKKMVEFMSIGMTGMPSRHPLFDKFTDAHIDKYLDSLQRDDDHAYKLASTNRFFYLAVFGVVVGLMIFLVVFLLPDNKELLYEILKAAAVYLGGLGSGIGIQVIRKSKRD